MTRSDRCPRCNVTMTDVIVTGDVLYAHCDNCDWRGEKHRIKPNTTTEKKV
jgi:hypothetical protein